MEWKKVNMRCNGNHTPADDEPRPSSAYNPYLSKISSPIEDWSLALYISIYRLILLCQLTCWVNDLCYYMYLRFLWSYMYDLYDMYDEISLPMNSRSWSRRLQTRPSPHFMGGRGLRELSNGGFPHFRTRWLWLIRLRWIHIWWSHIEIRASAYPSTAHFWIFFFGFISRWKV